MTLVDLNGHFQTLSNQIHLHWQENIKLFHQLDDMEIYSSSF